MFALKCKKAHTCDKNAHTAARFACFSVFLRLFVSSGFS